MVLKDPSSCSVVNWMYVARVEWGYQSGGRFVSPQGIRESNLVRMVTHEEMKKCSFMVAIGLDLGLRGSEDFRGTEKLHA